MFRRFASGTKSINCALSGVRDLLACAGHERALVQRLSPSPVHLQITPITNKDCNLIPAQHGNWSERLLKSLSSPLHKLGVPYSQVIMSAYAFRAYSV